MTNIWVYYAKCYIFIIPFNPNNTLMRKVLFWIQFDIWSKPDLMMLNNSTVKSLKQVCWSWKPLFTIRAVSALAVHAHKTKQKNSCVEWRQTLTFFLSGHVKWVKRKNGGNKEKEILCLEQQQKQGSHRASRLGANTAEQWSWTCCFEPRECSLSFNACHPGLCLEDTQ